MKKIKVAMIEEGITMIALAKMIGMSKSALSDRIRGDKQFRVDEAIALMKALNRTFEQIFLP